MNVNEEPHDELLLQIERLKTFFSVKSVAEVFEKLDIKLSTYTNYYNKKKLPDKLIKRLMVNYQLNQEWLFYGRGSQLLIPSSPKRYELFTDKVEEPSTPYLSSSCMIICDAIQRRDPKHHELLIAQILTFINSLDTPLKTDASDKVQVEK